MTDSTMAGRLLAGRYRLARPLGRGGMGVVWQARDELLGRLVAVKEVLLPPELPDEEREVLRRRTLREARSAARLSHPNVVTVFDVVEEDGRPWIVMELVRSTTLAHAIREYGPLPPREVARIGLQVLAALHAAHRAGVLHRDVKPSNVLLTGDGRVVLTDFGIATLEGDPSLTMSGTLLGSPAFIAPERVQGRGAGTESDLWSLGATLYTAVEGRPPYDRGTTLPTLAAAVTEEPDPARLAGPLWPALEGLLRKNPADRIDVWEARHLLQQAETAPEASSGAPGAEAVDTTKVDSGQRTRMLPVPPIASRPAAYAGGQPTGDGTPVATPAGVTSSASGPVAEPDSASSEWRESSNGNRPKIVGAMLACVLVAVALIGWGLFRAVDDNQGSQSQPTSSPRPSEASKAPRSTAAPSSTPPPNTRRPSSPATSRPASPSSRPTSPESPATEPGAVPAGFERHTDPTGFSLAVPAGWTVDRQGGRVYFREPGGARFLLIDQTDQPKPDPVADWRQQEAARRDGYDDYQRIRIEPVDYFEKAADWEFTYATPSGRRHVIIRGVVTSDKRAYGIYWSTPDTQWTESRSLYRTFTKTFQPAS
ncbi:serine/threonine protein kinase [Kribbella sp. NBC_00359]|uniref:serine/threonine protein kinase n=1 Tax=Kribbella sp. NBC_00359 TaxID=2975966 RepID=UPI002E1F33AA